MKKYYLLMIFSAMFIFLLLLTNCNDSLSPCQSKIDTVYKYINLGAGLIAYYPFDGDSKDYSGFSHDGINYGSAHYITGHNKLAIAFNGFFERGYVKVSNTNVLKIFENRFTFACWLRRDEKGGTDINGNYSTSNGLHCIFAKGSDRNGFFSGLGNYADSTVLFGSLVRSWNNQEWYAKISNDYKLGDWFHWAIVNTGNKIKIYVNSKLVTDVDAVLDMESSRDRDLYIGRFEFDYYPFKGAIDEFYIYNRALNEDEIVALYHK